MNLYGIIKHKLELFELSKTFYQEQKITDLIRKAEDYRYLESDYNNLHIE